MTRPRLTDIPGVGERKASRLRDAGFRSVESVATAAIDDLMAVPHIGWATADAMQRQARLLLEVAGEGQPGADIGPKDQGKRSSDGERKKTKNKKGKGKKRKNEKAWKKGKKEKKEKKGKRPGGKGARDGGAESKKGKKKKKNEKSKKNKKKDKSKSKSKKK